MENKGKTWSRGTNLRLPFGVNVNLNLSVVRNQHHINQSIHNSNLIYPFCRKKMLA